MIPNDTKPLAGCVDCGHSERWHGITIIESSGVTIVPICQKCRNKKGWMPGDRICTEFKLQG